MHDFFWVVNSCDEKNQEVNFLKKFVLSKYGENCLIV